ncbi:MAG TPA: FAD-binding protein [Rhizomicrobium sp.]|nr:FAD-binding protein [Rhizomicrobium sp.]
MILIPQNENELADMVRAAASDERSFEIVGRGTKRGLGRTVRADDVVDLSALSGIVRYEPNELVITARAGTRVAEIEAALAEKNQCLGFEPADWSAFYGTTGTATIGGVLSADASGSARLRFGAARDHLLGFAAVNGLGEIYKAGGRVVKNVTGFDLPKLFCGAMGTLGPLTEVTLRLVPRAVDCAVLAIRGVEPESGLEILRRIWSSPLEPTGLAYIPRLAAEDMFGDVGEGISLIRIEGAPAPLADKIGLLPTLLDGREATPLAHDNDIFARIASGAAIMHRKDDIWRAFVPPASAAACARKLAPAFWLADWAGGALWLAGVDDVQAVAQSFGGHALLMRADDATRMRVSVFPLEDPVRAALTQRIKEAFDPHRLFNPDRMFEGV